ncbi:MAG: transposase [Clostridia bacterium]|nr:transposase [Clostridia bacterium]
MRKWVNAYSSFGNEGLLGSHSNKHYSFDFKLYVVEFYLTTDISYQELAITEGILTPTVITRWVSAFKAEGTKNSIESIKRIS